MVLNRLKTKLTGPLATYHDGYIKYQCQLILYKLNLIKIIFSSCSRFLICRCVRIWRNAVDILVSVSELTNQIVAFRILKVITTIWLVNSLIDPRSLTRWEYDFNQIGSNSIPNYLIINSHDISWAELVLKMLMKSVLFHISVGHSTLFYNFVNYRLYAKNFIKIFYVIHIKHQLTVWNIKGMKHTISTLKGSK